MTQQAETWIFVARTTGAELLATDQTGEMTRGEADVVAARFMDLFVARIEAEYPDADIEVGQGNGLDGIKVQDAHEREDEIRTHLDSIATGLWESGEVWETN